MSMGSMVFTVTLTPSNGGRHTQYVDFKDNPIRFAGDLVAAIAARQDELDTQDVHPLAGAERIDLGILHAGDYFNRTPVSCRFTGTRRWSPGKSAPEVLEELEQDRKSTRLNSSHKPISYAVFCLNKKKKNKT